MRRPASTTSRAREWARSQARAARSLPAIRNSAPCASASLIAHSAAELSAFMARTSAARTAPRRVAPSGRRSTSRRDRARSRAGTTRVVTNWKLKLSHGYE
ncbi:MAG: hypothetical protein DMF81_16620 [Acidobacteria bacterium]|nr:MAG: hypothetical protein DMF81_16620 [Acidobacteriota bacterium]